MEMRLALAPLRHARPNCGGRRAGGRRRRADAGVSGRPGRAPVALPGGDGAARQGLHSKYLNICSSSSSSSPHVKGRKGGDVAELAPRQGRHIPAAQHKRRVAEAAGGLGIRGHRGRQARRGRRTCVQQARPLAPPLPQAHCCTGSSIAVATSVPSRSLGSQSLKADSMPWGRQGMRNTAGGPGRAGRARQAAWPQRGRLPALPQPRRETAPPPHTHAHLELQLRGGNPRTCPGAAHLGRRAGRVAAVGGREPPAQAPPPSPHRRVARGCPPSTQHPQRASALTHGDGSHRLAPQVLHAVDGGVELGHSQRRRKVGAV